MIEVGDRKYRIVKIQYLFAISPVTKYFSLSCHDGLVPSKSSHKLDKCIIAFSMPCNEIIMMNMNVIAKPQGLNGPECAYGGQEARSFGLGSG